MKSHNESQTFPKGLELRADAAIAGLLSQLPSTGLTQLTVGGVTYQTADLVQHAQELLQPWKDIRGAHSVIRTVMQNRPEDAPKLRKFLTDLKYAIGSALGRENEELRHYGFAPARRRRELTSEEKLAQAEKARATREAQRPKKDTNA